MYAFSMTCNLKFVDTGKVSDLSLKKYIGFLLPCFTLVMPQVHTDLALVVDNGEGTFNNVISK